MKVATKTVLKSDSGKTLLELSEGANGWFAYLEGSVTLCALDPIGLEELGAACLEAARRLRELNGYASPVNGQCMEAVTLDHAEAQ